MLQTDIEIAAQSLADARKAKRRGVPPAFIAARLENEAEAIRDAATQAMGETRIGWKVGATSPESQALFGCDGPFFGPMLASFASPAGTDVAVTEDMIGLECEFAFRLASDLPVRETLYTGAEIGSAVASCHPSIEIIGRRTQGDGLPDHMRAVADFGLNAWFVEGPAVADWTKHDLAAVPVVGFVDGVEVKRGSGAMVLGHPLNGLAWLANALNARGSMLTKGEIVTTGTCLGVIPVTAGTRVTGDFGPLGKIEIALA